MPQKHKIRYTGPSKPRQCGGKNCYPTRHDAEMVRDEKAIIDPELQLDIYHCLDCATWHLTRRDKPTS
ncbi:hypothetical protein KA093_01330 [Candidatus Saccharibacteria bacterium]|nr:hypothetical protein [Candidatus Saccharibacteria bacterium]